MWDLFLILLLLLMVLCAGSLCVVMQKIVSAEDIVACGSGRCVRRRSYERSLMSELVLALLPASHYL